MNTTPAPPAEAELIRERRETLRISRYEVARRAGRGVSEPTVRRYETGADGVTRDPLILARIAAVLGVTPGELEQAGRGDAAAQLSALSASAAAAPDVAELTGGGPHDGDSAWTGLLGEIMAGLAAIDGTPGLTAADRAQLRGEFLAGLRHDAAVWRRGLGAVRRVTGHK